LLGFQVVGDPESLGTVSFTNLVSKHLMVSIYFEFTNSDPPLQKNMRSNQAGNHHATTTSFTGLKNNNQKKPSEKPSSPIFFGI